MKDTKNTPQSEWERGDFYLHVALDHSLQANEEGFPVQKATNKGITVLEIKDLGYTISNYPHSHADIIQAVFQWLRDVDHVTRMKFIAGLVLEHQISYHLNTQTEEASLNMQEDDVIQKILSAVKACAQRDESHASPSVEISAVYQHLEKQSFLLPSYVIYSVLKTLEECVPGSCVDLGEGFFRVHMEYL